MLNRWSLTEEKRRWPPSLWKDISQFERIVVVGPSGSGKSSLSRALAENFSLTHVELDSFQHGPRWAAASEEELRARTAAAIQGKRWVVDGNYKTVRDLVWPRAQAVVWIHESFPRTFLRLLRRTVSRSWQKEELWNGNRESWRMSFLSRDSVLLWGWRSFGRTQRGYTALFKERAWPSLVWIEIRNGKAERLV